jgi:hypothetical protein
MRRRCRTGDAATLSAGLARNIFESEDAERRRRRLARYALGKPAGVWRLQDFAAVLKTPTWAEISQCMSLALPFSETVRLNGRRQG